MLSFSDPRLGRRDFLRIGSLALGGLSLSSLARAADPLVSRPMQDKSVVFLFLHGGPSQMETFDPHMFAPAEIRSATGELQTALPGITFGGTFPKLAKMADKLSVVRSFVPGDANHDIKTIVGKDTFGANLGSAYSYVAGTNHPQTGLPTNVALFPRAVDPSTQAGVMQFGKFDATGPFGASTAPFMPGAGGSLQKDMKLSLPMAKLEDRRDLLRQLDRMKVELDNGQRDGLNGEREKAFRILIGGIGEAFDLAREDTKTISRYDTAPLVRPENIDKKWKNYNNYVDNSKALGKLLLLSRRLCERGAGFVTVTTSFVWDMHSDVNNAPVGEGMRYMGTPLDHAVSAFLEDLEARGLSEKILLVVCGEMGRTPRINKGGGRDHWGNLGPLLLAGGGLKMGQVIGQSARNGGEPNSDPVTVKNLVGTVMNTLFDTGKLRVVRGMPREILQMGEWAPIPGLL
ncbi:MAG: DUF1501 domain-containing protein [Planctomycetes bacterium]|nr:DUF1501 domain-containing protein [Planctomycetota bacterium]